MFGRWYSPIDYNYDGKNGAAPNLSIEFKGYPRLDLLNRQIGLSYPDPSTLKAF